MKHKFMKKWFEEHNINYDEYDGKFFVYACSVGDNFYDYGEDHKPIEFDEEFEWMANDPWIVMVECCECCGCAGW